MKEKKLKFSLVRVSAFAFASVAFALSSGSPASAKSEWVLEQHHHQSGYNTFYFTDDAIKVYAKNFGFYIVSKAPDWNVNAFRLDDKIICSMPRAKYYAFQHFYPEKNPINDGKPIGTETVWSVVCKQYTGVYHDDWVAQFKGITRPVWDLISAHYKAQRVEGINLKSVKKAKAEPKRKLSQLWDEEVDSGVRLQTLKLKEIPFRASDFAIPSGYRVAKDLRQIMTSKESRREAESIIEQMGLGEALGGDAKKK